MTASVIPFAGLLKLFSHCTLETHSAAPDDMLVLAKPQGHMLLRLFISRVHCMQVFVVVTTRYCVFAVVISVHYYLNI